jgi:hypothetical protein
MHSFGMSSGQGVLGNSYDWGRNGRGKMTSKHRVLAARCTVDLQVQYVVSLDMHRRQWVSGYAG